LDFRIATERRERQMLRKTPYRDAAIVMSEK
jgi:hypothetical protein